MKNRNAVLEKLRATKKALEEKAASEPKPKRSENFGKAPHLVVVARAGTGKTTTCVGGLALLCGDKPQVKKPSKQQRDIWDAMCLERPEKIRVCAFSKAIQLELERRIPWSICEVRTTYSLGLGFLKADERFRYSKKNDFKTLNILEEVTGVSSREFRKKGIPSNCVDELVRLSKLNMVLPHDPDCGELMDQLIAFHDIPVENNGKRVIELATECLAKSMEFVTHPKWKTETMPEYDYSDMIWLPIALDLEIEPVDLVVVDESQDLNLCQQELVARMGRRVVLIGDPMQAVFGFAGADCYSMDRMTERLRETTRGVESLPLNITYRCGRKIVELAKEIVPDYEAYEKNPEGVIRRDVKDHELTNILEDGDMVVCRVNAPLISQCFRLLEIGKKARIQGRNIGEGLIRLIDRLKATDLDDLATKLCDWHAKEVAKIRKKKYPNEALIIAANDKLGCLLTFIHVSETLIDVRNRIDSIFQDSGEGVLLSSVHRSKGLEANRVFILQPEKMPHPMAKTPEARMQEQNLRYVAWTRAINELIFVKTTEKQKEEETM